MLKILAVNHIGIRVANKAVSVAFYEGLGFELIQDTGFEKGHPVILRHPGGVVLNLLGPATSSAGTNILMDVAEKHPGYTHVALTVESLEETKESLGRSGVQITGSFSFGNMSAVFIRDPDRNVIELDAYGHVEGGDSSAYASHPS